MGVEVPSNASPQNSVLGVLVDGFDVVLLLLLAIFIVILESYVFIQSVYKECSKGKGRVRGNS